MIAVSDNFIERSRSQEAETSIRVTMGTGDSAMVLGPAEVQSAEVAYSDGGDFTVGGTTSAGLKLTVLSDALPQDVISRDIKVEIGYRSPDRTWQEATGKWGEQKGTWALPYGGDEWEWLPMGTFATSDRLIARNGLFAEVQAYDTFYWMNEDCSVSVPAMDGTTKMNVLSQMKAIASAYGISMDESTVPDVGFLTVRPTGKVRACISQLAMACFADAAFEDGKLVFRKLADTGMTADESDYTGGSFTKTTGERATIDHVSVEVTKTHSSADDEANVAEDETTTQVFPMGTTGLAMQLDSELFAGGEVDVDTFPKVYDAVGTDLATVASQAGFSDGGKIEVRGFSCELWGWPWLRPKDMLTIESSQIGDLKAMCTEVTVSYDGAVRTTIGASASSESSDTYSSAPSASIASGGSSGDPITSLQRIQREYVREKIRRLNMALAQLDIDLTKNDEAIETAFKAADDANRELARTAQSTADGKNAIYVKDEGSAPTDADAKARGYSGLVQGDMWYATETEDGEDPYIVKVYMWNGSKWVPYQMVADSVMVPSSVGTVLIADGAVTADKVLAHSIGAEKIVANSIGADQIAAHCIGSDQILAHSIVAESLDIDTLRTALAWFGVSETGNRVKVDGDGMGVYAGNTKLVNISQSGINGIFYASRTWGMNVTATARTKSTFQFSTADATKYGVYPGSPWRPFAFTRLSVSGSKWVSIAGFDINPSGFLDDGGNVFSVTLVNHSLKDRNVAVNFQLLWLKGSNQLLDGEAKTDGSFTAQEDSSGSEPTRSMSMSGDTLKITWES